ncbi:MAG: hypothetical protein SFU98_21285 [Leptospiraceae bacterium]|nr:hypothetical protein [Leptospiraceae bacterium]
MVNIIFDNKGKLLHAFQILVGTNDPYDGKNWDGKIAYSSAPSNRDIDKGDNIYDSYYKTFRDKYLLTRGREHGKLGTIRMIK